MRVSKSESQAATQGVRWAMGLAAAAGCVYAAVHVGPWVFLGFGIRMLTDACVAAAVGILAYVALSRYGASRGWDRASGVVRRPVGPRRG